MYQLAEIMTRDVVTLSPDDTLSDARDLMRNRHIRHIPIIEDGSLVGLVTQRDVLAAMESTLYRVPADQKEEREQWIRVADFMTRDIATVDERGDLQSTARCLERYKLGCLPVVTDGKLVGIVTDGDFVGLSINLLEQMDAQEPIED